jgi:hypothetical protein
MANGENTIKKFYSAGPTSLSQIAVLMISCENVSTQLTRLNHTLIFDENGEKGMR